ncbi:MAG: nicotinate (nicotinamide) nucleotide adenylyltransferase [Anaerolineae bacterium]|nr:nicotinate (nicotinamide) nucleotide adenylyltransferase [Anaerolineae bacterium]
MNTAYFSFPVSRLGIFGGSFDPPHYGHLALAETARVQLQLDGVLFVPAGAPPHKSSYKMTAGNQRVALVQAAIADNTAFALSCVDVTRPGPHYTVDMLELLRDQFLDVTAWFFLMGEDSLRNLSKWHAPERILDLVQLAVMPRMGTRVNIDQVQKRLPQLRERLYWLDMPPVNLSATDLRRRAQIGLPLRYLVPPGVETYIREHKLYA